MNGESNVYYYAAAIILGVSIFLMFLPYILDWLDKRKK